MSINISHKRLDLLQYSMIALPLAFAGLPIYVHAPEFYASELGISLTTIGLTLLGLRIFDAVQDPFIGSISDRLHAYRKHIMMAGMIAMGSGFWMVFHPSTQYPIIWFALGIMLCTTGFSVVSINFQALGSLWISGVAERTRITSWREAVGLIGLLLASISPTLLGGNNDAASAFNLLAWLYLPLLAILGFGFFRWMDHAAIQAPQSTIRGSIRASMRTDPFSRLYTLWNVRFFGIYLCNIFASSIPAVLVIFFIKDRLDAESMTGLFLLLYFLSGALAMPLWRWLAKNTGKARAWMISMWLAVITFIWAFMLGAGDVAAYGVVCVLSGSALGADLALPPSIIADQIDRQKDQDAASRYFAIMTFLSKAAFALATGIMLPLLGQLGYQPGDTANDSVTGLLNYAYALIPCLLKALVALWLWRFIHQTNQGDFEHEARNHNHERAHIS